MRYAICILILALAAGCWSQAQSGSGDPSGTDTDSDGDSDSDSDSDADDTDTFPDPDVEPGELLWAKRAGGQGIDYAIGLDSLPDGSCAVVGTVGKPYIGDSAVFGQGESNQTTLHVNGFSDGFVARLGYDGNLTWVRDIGGSSAERALDAAGLDDGSVAVVGEFESVLDIEAGGYAVDMSVFSNGGVDGYVLLYGEAGYLMWAQAIGGAGDDALTAIDAAAGTGLRAVGAFSESVILGADGPNETEIIATATEDAFVAAFGEDGGFEWVEIAQVSNSGWGMLGSYDASVAQDGASAFIGPWNSPATFAPGEPEETSFSEGMVMIARYQSDGTLEWALSDGIEDGYYANFPHECTGIAQTDDGGVYFSCKRFVSTYWDATMEFGVGQSDQVVVDGMEGYDALIGHYGPGGTLGWIVNEGSVNSDGAAGIAVLDDGSVVTAGYHGADAVFGTDGDNETALETDTYTQVRAFVAEYDSDGQLLWASSAGGGFETVATAVARSADGCILVAGYFNGTAVFGAGELHETTLHSAGQADIFVAKYAP